MLRLIVISWTILAIVANFVISVPFSDKVSPTIIDSEKRATSIYRLPNNTIPLNYKVSLITEIHKRNFTFVGSVQIDIEVKEKSSEIKLHHRQLNIESCKVNKNGDTEDIVNKYTYETETEILTIQTKEELPVGGLYTIHIAYNGTLRGDNAGFYRSYYDNQQKERVWLATTQFESTDARHGFPCYDEPQIKANFTIQVTHGEKFNAISNMPVESRYPRPAVEDGMLVTKFKETEKMSTYLVAFVVSDFESTSAVDPTSKLEHRVYSQPEFKDEQKFALDTSVNTLRELEKYLDVKYTFPKMDQIAVPDFAAGAMENWGLVTYREEYLLWDPKESPDSSKTGIANIIAHEYAHQWFGNLVSPHWWTFIWLNEGFATLFSYIGANLVQPDWNIMEYFIVAEYQNSLASDSIDNPRPMTHYVDKPDDIAGLFDSVSYGKAGNVLRMFQHTLGENTFKKGLKKYLVAKDHSAAEEDDLFNALREAAVEDKFIEPDFDLGEVLKPWTHQGGYPLLTVTRDYSNGSFVIKQEPFLASGGKSDNRKWPIPFNFVTSNNADFNDTSAHDFITAAELKVYQTENTKWSKDDWLILNKQQTGFYRVNYDEENWKLLTKALEKNVSAVHVYNRAQLIDDAFKLVLAKKLKYDTALGLMEYLRKETEYAPWAAANNVLSLLNNYFKAEKNYDLFAFYTGILMNDFYKDLGTNNSDTDSHLRKYSRNIAINWACEINAHGCLEDTSQKFKAFIENGTEIHPNLRTVVFCNGLKNSTDEEYKFVYDLMLSSKDQAERRQLMSVLGCSMNYTHLSWYLLTSTGNSADINYRVQERIMILGSVYGKGGVGVNATIDFLMEHAGDYAEIGGDFTKANPLVTALRGIAQKIVTNEQEEHFNILLNKVKNIKDVTEADIKALKNTVQNNLKWITENKDEVFNWLAEFKKRNSAASLSLSLVAMASVIIVTLRNIF